MNRPRSLFRGRRRAPVLYVGGRPDDDRPRIVAEAQRLLGGRPRPGETCGVEVVHAPDCWRPQGERCTCRPAVRLAFDQGRN